MRRSQAARTRRGASHSALALHHTLSAVMVYPPGPTFNAAFFVGARAELPARLVDAGLLRRGAEAARGRGASKLLRDTCQTRFIATCGHTPQRFWMTKVSDSVNDEACSRPTTGEGLDDADARAVRQQDTIKPHMTLYDLSCCWLDPLHRDIGCRRRRSERTSWARSPRSRWSSSPG